jgi:rare lipoprotein A
MRQTFLTAVVLGVALLSCGEKKKVRAATPPHPPARAAAPLTSFEETGMASWYGHPYHGRASASGEIYDMEQMTAAHRTLPFGAQIRVHNLSNEKTVDVRITDRGPFIDGRIIDLSHAAARSIGLIGPGVAKVRLEMISAPAVIATGYYGVQVGAFKVRENAERLRREMEAQHGSCKMVLRAGEPPLWRVLVGREPTIDGANALAQRLRQEKTGQAFVVRIDAVQPGS